MFGTNVTVRISRSELRIYREYTFIRIRISIISKLLRETLSAAHENGQLYRLSHLLPYQQNSRRKDLFQPLSVCIDQSTAKSNQFDSKSVEISIERCVVTLRFSCFGSLDTTGYGPLFRLDVLLHARRARRFVFILCVLHGCTLVARSAVKVHESTYVNNTYMHYS